MRIFQNIYRESGKRNPGGEKLFDFGTSAGFMICNVEYEPMLQDKF